MNKALVLVMCDVLVLSAMSLSSGTFSSSGLSGNDTDSKSFTKKEIDDAEVERGLLTNKLYCAFSQVTNLLGEVRNATNRYAQLEKERDGLANELDGANAQVTNLLGSVRIVTNLYVKAEVERKKAEDDKEKMKAEAEVLKRSLEDFKGKLSVANAGKLSAEKEAGAMRGMLEEAQKKIKSIDDAEQERRDRIDRMIDSIGRIERVRDKKTLGNGLIVHREIDGERSWFLLTHESFIKTKRLSEIKIMVKSKYSNSLDRECSVQKVYSFKDGGGMRLLAFDPPGEIFSFCLGTDEWRNEIYPDSTLHMFKLKRGGMIKKEIVVKTDGVEVMRDIDFSNSEGDVLISTRTGRVSFRCLGGTIYRIFCPIGKIKLVEVPLENES